MLQIIGGQYRSRRLQTPPDAGTTRPYAQRVKESVFNILRGHWEGARVLDLFAGVGTMGLEAVSRGAAEVLMVEQDRRIYALLEKNVQELGCEVIADTLRGDALGSVSLLRSPRPLDVIFVDPPFAMMRDEAGRRRVLDHIARAVDLLADDGMIVLRTPLDAKDTSHEIASLAGPEIREYRRHHQVLLYTHKETSP
ncbi:MAG: 16S rRNA (guanine(966)-N(2))-methyltransferase RsmD [Phycisphaerales bacterium]|jgi:16S rRNA (guanine966-N2)-methyltransferase|nr:16S rRNA (guanine(966)-N(2))-methyltransferase RsmD [Phycisphaerales bacterium]HCA39102.1 16S rRNA (guanine(966)-N(2))-methyltransferase RsmD [Phycisphaerales bacterium]